MSIAHRAARGTALRVRIQEAQRRCWRDARRMLVGISTYRLTVVGVIVSSFLLGLHVPALHDMIDHGATPRWEVVTMTLLLAVSTAAGGWMLLRPSTPRP